MPTHYYLAISAALFAIGVLGVLLRRNTIVIFMCIELMLNAANLAFVAAARHFAGVPGYDAGLNASRAMSGQVMVFFVMTVAAAEVAVGLAIIVALFRNRGSIDVDDVNLLKY